MALKLHCLPTVEMHAGVRPVMHLTTCYPREYNTTLQKEKGIEHQPNPTTLKPRAKLLLSGALILVRYSRHLPDKAAAPPLLIMF